MATPKMMKLGDIFSTRDVEKAARLVPDVNAIEEQVIKPSLAEINERTGQENDSRYLAYALMYALQRNGGSGV